MAPDGLAVSAWPNREGGSEEGPYDDDGSTIPGRRDSEAGSLESPGGGGIIGRFDGEAVIGGMAWICPETLCSRMAMQNNEVSAK
jgi:hypothetical protein